MKQSEHSKLKEENFKLLKKIHDKRQRRRKERFWYSLLYYVIVIPLAFWIVLLGTKALVFETSDENWNRSFTEQPQTEREKCKKSNL